MATLKEIRRTKVKGRVRQVVSGDATAPRLSVYRSNKQVYAQLIDDVKGVTLASAASSEKGVIEKTKGLNKIDQAKLVGSVIAKKAVEAGFSTVRFDRNGYLYHGRVKALAEGAREAGLKF